MVRKLSSYFVFIYVVMHFLVSPIILIFGGSSITYELLHSIFGPFYVGRFGFNFEYVSISWWILDFIYLLLTYFSVALTILIFVKWNEPESTEVLQTPPGILD
jgi:hypothetical protein